MTLLEFAQRFVGEVAERPGIADHPFIVWCHESCRLMDTSDEVPWCSSFVNRLCWVYSLSRSHSAKARSWLTIGVAIPIAQATPGWCVVIMKRGAGVQPGPEDLNASGHVTLFAGMDGFDFFLGTGGNQRNNVTTERYPISQVLGVRRLRLDHLT